MYNKAVSAKSEDGQFATAAKFCVETAELFEV